MHRIASTRKYRVLSILTLGLLVGVFGGLASGSIPNSSDGRIYACYKKANPEKGELRVIDNQTTQGQCTSKELPISWDPGPQASTLTLYDNNTPDVVGTNGTGVGRIYAWSDLQEYDNPSLTGTPVGQEQGSCTQTATASYGYECTWTYTLAGGDITASGVLTSPVSVDVSVVGGTGDYANATGVEHISASGTLYTKVFDLKI